MRDPTSAILIPALQFLATPSNSSIVSVDELTAQQPGETHDGFGLEVTLKMSVQTRAARDEQRRISYGNRLRHPTSAQVTQKVAGENRP